MYLRSGIDYIVSTVCFKAKKYLKLRLCDYLLRRETKNHG